MSNYSILGYIPAGQGPQLRPVFIPWYIDIHFGHFRGIPANSVGWHRCAWRRMPKAATWEIIGLVGYYYIFGGFMPPFTSEVYIPLEGVVFRDGWWYMSFGAVAGRVFWIHYSRNISTSTTCL